MWLAAIGREPHGLHYYADAEGGAYLEDPAHADLVGPIHDLDQASNTFVVLYPGDDTRDWSVSGATRTEALGGYEIERHDRNTSEAHPPRTPQPTQPTSPPTS